MDHTPAMASPPPEPRAIVEAMAATFNAQVRPMGMDICDKETWREWFSSGISMRAWRSRRQQPHVPMVPALKMAVEPDIAKRVVGPWTWCIAWDNDIKRHHDSHYARNQMIPIMHAIGRGDVATAHACVGLRSQWSEQDQRADGMYARIKPGHSSCPDGTPWMRVLDQTGQLLMPARVFDAGGRVATDDGHPERLLAGVPIASGPYTRRTGTIVSDPHVRPGSAEHTQRLQCMVQWDDEPSVRCPTLMDGIPESMPIDMVSRGVRVIGLGAPAMDVIDAIRPGDPCGGYTVFVCHELLAEQSV